MIFQTATIAPSQVGVAYVLLSPDMVPTRQLDLDPSTAAAFQLENAHLVSNADLVIELEAAGRIIDAMLARRRRSYAVRLTLRNVSTRPARARGQIQCTVNESALEYEIGTMFEDAWRQGRGPVGGTP